MNNHELNMPDWVKDVPNLPFSTKLDLWFKQASENVRIMFDWEIKSRTDEFNQNHRKNYGTPSFENKYASAYQFTKSSNYMSFDEFCSDSNVEVIDMGLNWTKFRYAQRYKVNFYGLYRYYEMYGEK